MATAVYTLDQVGRHQTRDSCWIVIDGKVYDVTEYIDQHPGGDREILDEAGTDATLPFAEVGHSSDAKEILETLRIGVLHPDDVRALSRKNGMTTWKKITVLAAVPLSLGLLAAFLTMRKK